MKKFAIPTLMVLVLPITALKAERPLLLSDINPSQLFSKHQIETQIKNIANKKSNELSILQNEFLTLQKINRLDVQALAESDLSFLQQQEKYKSQTFVRHDEGPLPLAIFDIASVAKFKLNHYYVFNEKQQYLDLLNRSWDGYKAAITKKDELTNVSLQAKLQAIDGLESEQYLELANKLIESRSFVDPLVVKVIVQTNDAYLIGDLLKNNDSAEALKIMNDKVKTFNTVTQAELLQSIVSENKNLASSALIQYGKLPANVRSDSWLVKQLSDTTLGSSAAKAIGLSQIQSALESARDLVSNSNSTRVEVANGLLALKFANNSFASTELTQLLERNLIPFEDMKMEVEKWLD